MPGKCARCGIFVGAAEEKLALDKSWHLECFTCAICNKGLDSVTLAEHHDLNEIYCKNCYKLYIGFQGYGYGKGAEGPTLIVFEGAETKNFAQEENKTSRRWTHPPTRLGNRFVRNTGNIPHYKRSASVGALPSKMSVNRSKTAPAMASNVPPPPPMPPSDANNKTSYKSNTKKTNQTIKSGSNKSYHKPPPPPPPLPPPWPPASKQVTQSSSRSQATNRTSSRAQNNVKSIPRPPPPPPKPQSSQYRPPGSGSRQNSTNPSNNNIRANTPSYNMQSDDGHGCYSTNARGEPDNCPPGFYCGGRCVGTPSFPRHPPCFPEERRTPLGPGYGSVFSVPKGIGEKCRRCRRPVFLAELMLGYRGAYHIECFNCCACGKKLDSTTVSEHQGEIFCKGCYRRNFAIQGVGFGIGAGTLQTP